MRFELDSVYHKHLDFTYTSIDRLYLRGYIPILQTCGGFRTWSEQLRPGEPVTQSWIKSLARRFHNNVRKFASEHNIPIIKPEKGQRKHLLADTYREKFNRKQGVYLILTSFESAPDYVSEEPRRPTESNHRNLARRYGFLTHYYFYIIDRFWGPICVVLSSHPPFNAKVFLNGHHWVECKARMLGLQFEKKGNAFLGVDDHDTLQKIADELDEREIRRVVDRWTYRVLPILTYQQRHDTRFHYQWSISQMEVCHNLVFHPSFPLAEFFQRHIDLNRRFLSPKSITTVFGKQHTSPRANNRFSIYRSYDSQTVLKVEHHKNIIKQYDKYGHIFRTECVSNDSSQFGVGKLLTNFAKLRDEMKMTLERFSQIQHAIAESTLARGELAALAQTSELGRSRVPGIRLENERIMTVLHILPRIASNPRGFASTHLRELYASETGKPYASSQASYDLRKLRAKDIIVKVPKTRRYRFTPSGARMTAILHKVRNMFVAPALAAASNPSTCSPKRQGPRGRPPQKHPTEEQLRKILMKHAGNVSAVAQEMKRTPNLIRCWIKRENIDLEEYRKPILRPDIEEAYDDVQRALEKLAVVIAL